MAITTATGMIVYNDQVRSAYAEKVAQAINGFFANTQGAVIVEDATVPGDYIKRSFWKMPSGLVSRRITTTTGYDSTVTPISIAQGEDVKVRLSRKIGPATITYDALRKIVSNPAAVSQVIGGMAAESVMQKMVNDSIMAAVGALNRSPYVKDISALTSGYTLNRSALAQALALMGDASNDVVCWVMHSKAYFDLVSQDITVATTTDSLMANVALYGATPASLGKPVIVTDDPSLLLDETVDKYYTLGLTAGAIQLTADTQLSDISVQEVSGLENLMVRIQGERDWFLGLKGFAWDTANGGINPDDTALATATNWDAVATSAKHRAGVIIKSQ
jgi:hypothetical protein